MTGLEGVSAYLDGPALAVALAVFGLVVGVLIGLFGVGGGFLVTPLLKLLFGIPYPVAVGSSLCFTIGSASSGFARHLRLRNVEIRSTILMAAGAVVGAVLGANLNLFLNERFGGEGSEVYDLIMHGLFIVMLLATGFMLLRQQGGARCGASVLQRLPLPPRIDLPSADLPGVSVPGTVLVGVAVGVLSGTLGIGGGIFMMPLLLLVVGLTPHQAVGTSLGVVAFSSIAGTVEYATKGEVNLWVAMALLVGSTVGIQVGAWLCARLRGPTLTRYFAALVFLLVAFLVFDFARKMGGG